MNCSTTSPTPPRISCAATPLTLRLRGCGNVVSFKNTKKIARIKGRPALITDPRKQKAMDSYIRAFESLLNSAYRTSATGMATGCSLASWIRSCVPLDDSRKWISEQSLRFIEVAKGDEGADVVLEIISDAKNRQREGLPGLAGSEELRGDDREGRGGASPLVGVQTQEQAEPQAAGGLPAEHARAAG